MKLNVKKVVVLKISGKFAHGVIKKPESSNGKLYLSNVYRFYPNETMKDFANNCMETEDLLQFIKELEEIRDLVDTYNITNKLSEA